MAHYCLWFSWLKFPGCKFVFYNLISVFLLFLMFVWGKNIIFFKKLFYFCYRCGHFLKASHLWLIDKATHKNKSTIALLPDLVTGDRRSLCGTSLQQLTCLLCGMDAPWSVGSADGDSPGAFERIWSRWVSFSNLHIVHEGFNHAKKHISLLWQKIANTVRQRELPQAVQSLCCAVSG